jgi:NADH-quinone oxidoreductase subunit J
MNVAAAFFYLFSGLMLASAFMVIAARNPVHSVLFLILAFVNAAGLFILLGAEFLAMILIVVYVGAVAVLFLFVVMMLDVDFSQLREGFARYLPIGLLVAGILTVEMVMIAVNVAVNGAAAKNALPQTSLPDVTNTETIGRALYTDYVYVFQAAGLVLLVAMIGAIVLTLRHKPGIKRQSIPAQNARTPKTGMTIVDIKPGEGISE